MNQHTREMKTFVVSVSITSDLYRNLLGLRKAHSRIQEFGSDVVVLSSGTDILIEHNFTRVTRKKIIIIFHENGCQNILTQHIFLNKFEKNYRVGHLRPICICIKKN